MTPVLELRRLSKRFGETIAVDEVSEAFPSGEYVCVLGPSGCGKTTLARLIAGFERPTSGDILLDGRSLEGVPPERRDVNVVFQSYALFPHLSVFENVAFGPRMKKQPKGAVRERVQEALRLVRLEALGGREPRQLSGGQQQRVALARALVNQPRVLLLDEPLSALDRSLRQAMQDELRTLQRRTGVTFVHITHDQNEAMGLADRLVVMRGGRLVQVGPPREVYRRPCTRFVAEFVGSSNVIEGECPPGPVSFVAAGGMRLVVDHLPDRAAGRRLVATIRPESIEIVEKRTNDQPNTFVGRICRVAFTGPVVECTVEVGPVVLEVHAPATAASELLVAGGDVTLRIQPADVVVLPDDDA